MSLTSVGHVVAKKWLYDGVCYHCHQPLIHDPSCIVAVALDRESGVATTPTDQKSNAQFVAAGVAVMMGLERVAVARSHNFAKRIAAALNNHKPGRRGY